MITIDYIKANQQENKHIRIMKEMFLFIDDLIDERNFKAIDDFIEEFCKEDMCLQYYVCLLTASHWVKNGLNNIEMLKTKAKEIAVKEIGEKNALKVLKFYTFDYDKIT